MEGSFSPLVLKENSSTEERSCFLETSSEKAASMSRLLNGSISLMEKKESFTSLKLRKGVFSKSSVSACVKKGKDTSEEYLRVVPLLLGSSSFDVMEEDEKEEEGDEMEREVVGAASKSSFSCSKISWLEITDILLVQ